MTLRTRSSLRVLSDLSLSLASPESVFRELSSEESWAVLLVVDSDGDWRDEDRL